MLDRLTDLFLLLDRKPLFTFSSQVSDEESESLAAFFHKNSYVRGTYDDVSSFARLNAHLCSLPGGEDAKRLFYLALPPTVYHHVSTNIRAKCMSSRSAVVSPKTPNPQFFPMHVTALI